MRIELERQDLRKKDQDPVRQLELACIFTLCGMKTEHKFLAYKSAFTLNYKASNFITASHFARQVIDLEPTGVSSAQDLNFQAATEADFSYLTSQNFAAFAPFVRFCELNDTSRFLCSLFGIRSLAKKCLASTKSITRPASRKAQTLTNCGSTPRTA